MSWGIENQFYYVLKEHHVCAITETANPEQRILFVFQPYYIDNIISNCELK